VLDAGLFIAEHQRQLVSVAGTDPVAFKTLRTSRLFLVAPDLPRSALAASFAGFPTEDHSEPIDFLFCYSRTKAVGRTSTVVDAETRS
jgi:hypothetical protein